MNDDVDPRQSKTREKFVRQIEATAARKVRAKRNALRGVWFGLGMTGLIGWSIVVPTLLGISLGIWLDQHHPGRHSWTLTLLVTGLFIGCLNAWHWVAKEEKAMKEDREESDE